MPRGIGLLGQKVGMTQVFDGKGRAVGATVLLAGPCTVARVRTKEADGYEAVQIAWREEPKPETRLSKAEAGVFAKAGLPPHRTLAEFQAHPVKAAPKDLAQGTRLDVSLFAAGERVDVQGDSKGRGFQGVVRRHGFKGGPDTHGSMSHRAPGSIGSSTDPGRTLRGLRMGGRMGATPKVSQNLEILRIDAERNLLVVKGAVPGAPGTIVRITPTTKKKSPSARRLWVEVRDADGAKTAVKKAPPKK